RQAGTKHAIRSGEHAAGQNLSAGLLRQYSHIPTTEVRSETEVQTPIGVQSSQHFARNAIDLGKVAADQDSAVSRRCQGRHISGTEGDFGRGNAARNETGVERSIRLQPGQPGSREAGKGIEAARHQDASVWLQKEGLNGPAVEGAAGSLAGIK